MRARPVVALSATLALLGGGTAVGAAGDAQDAPAAGSASSTLTLLDVGLGGTSLSVLELALRSDTLAGTPSTAFEVTPLTVGGKAYGRQSLSSRSAALPALDSSRAAPAAVGALAAARSPLVDVTVDGGTSRAATTSLGAVSVLGMPLALDGTASISSSVDGAGASGGKTLTVTRLALPSVADLLGALGLDLRTLPSTSLTSLLERLDLTSSVTVEAERALEDALRSVQPQLDPAEAAVAQAGQQVDAAAQQVAEARAALAPATQLLNDATKALGGSTGLLRRSRLVGLDPLPVQPPTVLDPAPTTPVTEAVTGALPETQPVQDAVPPVSPAPATTVDDVLETVTAPVVPPVVDSLPALPEVLPLPQLPAEIPVSLQPAADAYAAAKKAYDDALQAVRDAEARLDAARTLLADARRAVETLLAPYRTQVDALTDAVLGVLDATPLLSLDRLEVTTRSSVTSAAPGGQHAEVVGGQVQGLRVLGTDVLQAAVGRSEVEVLDLAGPAKAAVDTAVAGLTGTLSSVLSEVPGLPALEVPAPRVELLSRATSTDVVDGFGVAGSALRAVSVTWPGLKVPAAAALPGAASLPAVAGATALPALRVDAPGDLLTQPLTLSLATLEDRARFRPARASLQPGTTAPPADTATGAPPATTPSTGTPTTGTPTSGTPTSGTPTTGTPTTGTPTTGTPTTGTPDTAAPPTVPTGSELPRTGTDPSVLALLLLAAGLGLHRRYRSA